MFKKYKNRDFNYKIHQGIHSSFVLTKTNYKIIAITFTYVRVTRQTFMRFVEMHAFHGI